MADQASTAYGGFWIRFLAYLVDSVILFVAVILLAAVCAFLGPLGVWLIMGACLLGPLLYWGLMQASARQATFGKALLGMKVTDQSGGRISLLRSLGRELAKYLSAIPLMVGFLLAAFTGRKQALHDFVASTTVVREGPGHLVAALVVGVFGWLAPAALMMVLGVGLLAGMMGILGGSMMEQATMEAQKQQAAQSAPAQKPAVPVAPKSAPAPVPVAASTPVPVVAPAPAAAAPPKPVIVEAPKPAVVEAPKSAPLVRVAAVKPAPAPSPEPVEKPRAAATTPAAAAAQPPAPEARPGTPGPKYNDLMTAVLYRDAAAVNELIAFGRWPDKPDSQGVTPLMAAAMLGDTTNAEALLKAGANPDAAMPIARERRDGAMTALLERYATSKRP